MFFLTYKELSTPIQRVKQSVAENEIVLEKIFTMAADIHGPISIQRPSFPGIGIPMLKIR